MNPRYKPYSNPTQLLGMAIDDRDAVDVALVALPIEPGTAAAFKETAGKIQVWHQDWSLARLEEASFGLTPPAGPFDLCLLYLPKGVVAQSATFSAIAQVMKPGGRVLVAGEKKSGIASARALLRKTLGSADEKHSARHCLCWDLTVTEKPRVEAMEMNFTVEAWGQSADIISLPGTFAQGHLDDGTRFLLDSIDPKKFDYKEVLDWGCGAGVIGTIAQLNRKEAAVTFADNSAMALESTRRTLEKNKIKNAEVIASDGWSDLGDRKFELILTNPPAHRGLKTDRSHTETFLTEAPKHLKPGGRVLMVANGHLPYLPVLKAAFKTITVIDKNPRFQIIEAKI